MISYRASLEYWAKAGILEFQAVAQINLGVALIDQAHISEAGDAIQLLGEAVGVYREALTVFTREVHPRYHRIMSANLAAAETALAKLRGESVP